MGLNREAQPIIMIAEKPIGARPLTAMRLSAFCCGGSAKPVAGIVYSISVVPGHIELRKKRPPTGVVFFVAPN